MTSIWSESDFDATGYDDSEGLFDESDSDGEDFDGEASSARRRRARARRVELARRRQAVARNRTGAGVPATASTAQRTASAVRTLDLENKVQEDTFRNAIAAQNKRLARGEYAAVAGAAVSQFIDSFNAPDNPYAKAALRFSPLLLLSPAKTGTGIESMIRDPRVFGAAAVAGLVFFGERRKKSTDVRSIEFVGPTMITAGTAYPIGANVLDEHGRPVPAAEVTWSTSSDLVTIDRTAGTVTASGAGAAVITATVGDVKRQVYVTVTNTKA